MRQLPLPGLADDKPVNVASVPQRSPFRYPGGKTWLVPWVRAWLAYRQPRPSVLIEPFAGGAIVGLTAAFERLAEHVLLVELDDQVAAVWQTIITQDAGQWLSDRILSFDLTPENVDRVLAEHPASVEERAFQTIVKNRTYHGGILAAGSGKIKHGENGRGIASRWYPTTLAKRIRDIAQVRERLTFIHGDALDCIRQYAQQPDAVFFVDPPYTASRKKPGSRLYVHFDLDHDLLFDLMSRTSGDFLMTYDNDIYVQNLAEKYGFDTETIPMKNTHHARQMELLIGRDLRWARI